MKKVISIILIAATLMLAFLSVGCNKEETPEAPETSFTLSDAYTIIYPKDSSGAELSAANKLKTALSEFAGLNLAVTDDFLTDPSQKGEFEIIIGKCKRPDTKKAQSAASEIGYCFFASGKSIYIYATDDMLLDYAVNYVIENYISGKSEVSFPLDLNLAYNHKFSQTELKINGVDISKYRIVYGNDSYLKTGRPNNGKWIESGRYKDVATELQNEIYLLTKKKLPIAEASRIAESDYEIIVGWSDRKASSDYFRGSKMAIEDYAYGLSGNKVIFAGGSSNACYYAGKAFVDACKNMDGSNFTSQIKTGKADLIKVACIGDSITDGAGKMDDGSSNDHNVHSYPVYLQKLLGFKYFVGNYGHGGQRMMSFATESPNYGPSVAFKPDVVIMMFGTNDANKDKYTPDWGTDAAKTRYMAAASKMLEDYKKANASVQMFVMTPPSKIRNVTHQKNALLAAQYNREFASANGLTLIDMWAASEAENWVFNDGIHPQGTLYASLAEVVYNGVKDTIKK